MGDKSRAWLQPGQVIDRIAAGVVAAELARDVDSGALRLAATVYDVYARLVLIPNAIFIRGVLREALIHVGNEVGDAGRMPDGPAEKTPGILGFIGDAGMARGLREQASIGIDPLRLMDQGSSRALRMAESGVSDDAARTRLRIARMLAEVRNLHRERIRAGMLIGSDVELEAWQQTVMADLERRFGQA
jgi:hypothetical protein